MELAKCIGEGSSFINKRGLEPKEKQQSAFALLPEKVRANTTSDLLRKIERNLSDGRDGQIQEVSGLGSTTNQKA